MKRSILVKCKSPQIVNSYISGKKKRREITADALLIGAPKDVINVNKRFPPSLYKLRQEIIKKFPTITKRNIWISSSSVCLRLKDGLEPIKLYPTSNLDNIKNQLA